MAAVAVDAAAVAEASVAAVTKQSEFPGCHTGEFV
jgi:hypothetical protein